MTSLKAYVIHQLREMKREMTAVLEGLSDKDLTLRGSGGHGPIAWIVQHCCVNVDFFIHRGIKGEFFLDHEERFLAWPLIEPGAKDTYPPGAELIDRWTSVCDAAVAGLGDMPEDNLQDPGKSADPPEPLVESCLRVINHQNVHLRQIWCILGGRGMDEKWPVQQTWLA